MFSRTVKSPTRLKNWNTNPKSYRRNRRSSLRDASLIELPSYRTPPEVGAVRPAATCRSVDFPDPLGPCSARNSPPRSCKSISASAVTGEVVRENTFETFASSSSGDAPSFPRPSIGDGDTEPSLPMRVSLTGGAEYEQSQVRSSLIRGASRRLRAARCKPRPPRATPRHDPGKARPWRATGSVVDRACSRRLKRAHAPGT